MAAQPENWETVKALFEAALEEDPPRRAAYLRENCPDPEVRAEVERLLSEYQDAGTFLSRPILGNLDPPVESQQRFRDEEVLAGRFRIVRFIAAGGMGQVYEAEDLELRERVAIKTVRPEVLSQPDAVTRFKREVHLARKVTHANVCRIFDLFRHKPGTPEESLFVSMELLHGKTLAQQMKERGRISMEESLFLVQQMASALGAAHASGIVHRDFKPGNVVLVSAPGQRGERVVVTDFGLALRSVTSDETASLPTGQGFLGTPSYMSPEQLEGKPATAESDIYALGLVMYEMVTGARPFQGDTPISAAVKRLSQAPPPPRRFESTLSPVWEATILRCLERNPAKRFASVLNVSEALTGGKVAGSRHGRNRLRIAWAGAGALALVLATVVAFGYRNHWALFAHNGPQIKPRRSVAVLGFKNLTGKADEGWLSTALSDLLTSELAAGEQLRTVPGENLTQMKISLGLQDEDGYSGDTLSRIHRVVDADDVLVGSYLALGKETGGKVHLDLKLQDVGAGETTAVIVEDGTEDQLPQLVARAGAALLQKLGVPQLSSSQSGALAASVSTNLEANRFYAEGLAKARSFDLLDSKNLLQKAVAADPNFALAHNALSVAWDHLGYHQTAKEEASKAISLSDGLSREEKLSITARYQEANDEWDKAVSTFRTLFSFFPDNIEYGLSLARAQARAGKGRDALETVSGLRQLPQLSARDPRIDAAEAAAASSMGDLKHMQQAADRAVKQAEANGQRLFEARFLRLEGQAFEGMGQQKEARALWERAVQIDRELGDKGELGLTLVALGIQLDETGDLPGAKAMQEQALAIFREIGDTGAVPGSLIDLGNVLSDQGDPPAAQRLYEEALPLCREVGGKYCEASALENIANRMVEQGDLAGAVSKYEESAAIKREMGNQTAVALTLGNSGDLFYEMGDLNRSQESLQQGLEIATAANDRGTVGFITYKLGQIAVTRDNLVEARRLYEQAQTLHRQIEDPDDAAGDQLALVELEIEEGNLLLAESTARQVVEYFKAQKNSASQHTAQAVLAEVLLEKGDVSGAQKELAPQFQTPRNPNRMSRAQIAPVIARTLAKTAKTAQAIRDLKASLAEATRMKCVTCEFEERLALGEIEIESGEVVRGRARLAGLEKAAKAKGFLLIARKASAFRLRRVA